MSNSNLPSSSSSSSSPPSKDAIYASVKDYYGKVLQKTSDLRTCACTSSHGPPPSFLQPLLANLPFEILDKYYGCGHPLPQGMQGLRVLDLGCGSGRDSYLAAALVGEQGSVVGIDMTEEQLEVARKHADNYTRNTLGYSACNMQFVRGEIEDLRVNDNSIDLAISNCVLNLSPDKPRVLREVYRVLREGGEFYFSDVFCDRRLPAEVQQHKVLYGECLGGALYMEDFKRMCHAVGFVDPRVVEAPVRIEVGEEDDAELWALLGEAKFYSITYRLFKLAAGRLESTCEDYGQVAVYLGTYPGALHAYALDVGHRFEAHRPALVCGNTAAMLTDSPALCKHFQVVGDRSRHFGLFAATCGDCGEEKTTTVEKKKNKKACCGGGGSCC